MKRLIEKSVETLFKAVGYLPSNEVIYFESFHGKSYSDNPKAVYESIKKNYPEKKLVWGVTKGYEAPFLQEKVPFVRRFSLRWFFIMPRAASWVINTRTPIWLVKNKNTLYIQTWHGTPLKKLGCDIEDVTIPGYTTESYQESIRKESARWDILLSPSPYTTDRFREAFAYSGKILEKGYPRNDELKSNHDDIDKIKLKKQTLKIPQDKKIYLYAPTWRETDSKNASGYQFSIDFPYQEFTKKYGKEAILLVRMHYLVSSKLDAKLFEDGTIINVSADYDMSDLLEISDVLITDYSSSMFDFSLTNRPMIFYLPDRQAYEEDIRGFYFSLDEELPGPIVQTPTELLEIIKVNHQVEYKEKYEKFKNKFTLHETGHASVAVSHECLKKLR